MPCKINRDSRYKITRRNHKLSFYNQQNEISDKVTFLDYNNIDEHKLILMANALGCIYTSCDEDNHQLILETYYSQKPIITCTDSKFINTFVKDNITGLVVPPVSKLIAEAMDKLYFHKTTAEKMGKSGLEYIRSFEYYVE
ncbi:glycosyltransferase [Bacillus megaterium NBRC 15308 = ATCC 14581]|nr:glycosyltransferase [Priestia megaterium NBRC 15308 = ATCC 14581]